MQIIIDYLTAMTTDKISPPELAVQLGLSVNQINDFFKDHQNYYVQSLENKIYVDLVHLKADGSLTTNFLDRINPETTIEVRMIVNKQYLSETRALDIFIAKNLFGYEPYFGSYETDSSIGGMYSEDWLYANESKIPRYHKKADFIPELISKLNNKYFNILWNGISFTVTTYHHDNAKDKVEVTHTDLSLSVAQAIKAYLENPLGKECFVVLSQSETPMHPEDWDSESVLFETEPDAWQFIQQMNDTHEINYRIKKLK